MRLRRFFKNFDLNFAETPTRLHLYAKPLRHGCRRVSTRYITRGQIRVVFQDRLNHRQSREGPIKVEGVITVGDVSTAQNCHGQITHQRFSQIHGVMEIRIGPIKLEHREFRVMAR